MEILLLLIPVSVVLVLLIGGVFWWSVKSGQFDDLDGPAHRVLTDDDTTDAIPAEMSEGDHHKARQAGLTSVNPESGEHG
jgi:cbb3-type cytochrome oxidase maturation protein